MNYWVDPMGGSNLQAAEKRPCLPGRQASAAFPSSSPC